jgi:AAA15 family ATPase/GTPase
LKLAAIYGSNASGKTNIIKAIAAAQNLILNGTKAGQPIIIDRFRLSNEKKDEPTSIEFVILLDEELYTYGFALSENGVEEEWLYAQRPGAKERKLFERKNVDDKAVVETGKSLEEEDYKEKMLQMVARSTRANQLYLHELRQKNHTGLAALFDWFENQLVIVPATSTYRHLTFRATTDQRFVEFASKILKNVGTGVERVESAKRKIDLERDLPWYPEEMRLNIRESLFREENTNVMISSENTQRLYVREGDEIFEHSLTTIHRDKDGNEVVFDMEDESDGTSRLLHLIPLFLDIQHEPKVVFIDELDRRMHPQLSRALVDLFNDLSHRGSNSQLIFTTHDTNLMDQNLLRRDELWIIDKNQFGASTLSSIVDFNVRNDKKLDKDYLLGRFGGIPAISQQLYVTEHA